MELKISLKYNSCPLPVLQKTDFSIQNISGQTVNGNWTDWGNWSGCDCDHSTGTGTWNRTRSCTNPPPSCYGT